MSCVLYSLPFWHVGVGSGVFPEPSGGVHCGGVRDNGAGADVPPVLTHELVRLQVHHLARASLSGSPAGHLWHLDQ